MMNRIVLGLGIAAMTSGCVSLITGVQDTPIDNGTAASTIVRTYKFFPLMPAIGQQVFYECSNSGGNLDCVATCGVKNEQGEKVVCLTVAMTPQ